MVMVWLEGGQVEVRGACAPPHPHPKSPHLGPPPPQATLPDPPPPSKPLPNTPPPPKKPPPPGGL